MSTIAPEELLQSIAERINARNLDSLIMQHVPDACFAFLPGNVVCCLVEKVYAKAYSFIDKKRQVVNQSKESTADK